jgi:hypothetical protein
MEPDCSCSVHNSLAPDPVLSWMNLIASRSVLILSSSPPPAVSSLKLLLYSLHIFWLCLRLCIKLRIVSFSRQGVVSLLHPHPHSEGSPSLPSTWGCLLRPQLEEEDAVRTYSLECFQGHDVDLPSCELEGSSGTGDHYCEGTPELQRPFQPGCLVHGTSHTFALQSNTSWESTTRDSSAISNFMNFCLLVLISQIITIAKKRRRKRLNENGARTWAR